MSKKPSRKQRKDARQKASRGSGASTPPPRRKPLPARPLESSPSAPADRESDAGTTPVPARARPRARAEQKPARTNRQKAERAMLLFVGLVAIAGLIAYVATRTPDKTVMVPESPPRPTAQAGTEIPPPIEVREPKKEPAAEPIAPAPTAPPVDSSPPTIIPASSPSRTIQTAKPTAPSAAPKPASTGAPAAPKKKASSSDPY